MKMEKISAVYKILNEVTGDSYVGSSKDVNRRRKEHKIPSVWKRYSNNQKNQASSIRSQEIFNKIGDYYNV